MQPVLKSSCHDSVGEVSTLATTLLPQRSPSVTTLFYGSLAIDSESPDPTPSNKLEKREGKGETVLL